ncbi:unnamed protein product [Allacma fusca]|uniref:J domain-containing protein n=1 Tax=Allacma fusca TaxID=39272 RepID=A0A8J2Q332_9HEXA|nr:unnamed protein product [Allacma fusca]
MNRKNKDLYEVLQISKNATSRQIGVAKRLLWAKLLKDGEKDFLTFEAITDAYRILSDPELRHVYDDHGFEEALEAWNDKNCKEAEEASNSFLNVNKKIEERNRAVRNIVEIEKTLKAQEKLERKRKRKQSDREERKREKE